MLRTQFRAVARPVLAQHLPARRRSLASMTPPPPPTTSNATLEAPKVQATVDTVTNSASRAGSRFKSFLWSSVLLLGTGAFLVYAHDSRAGVWRWVVLPTVMALTKDDPEKAHEAAVDFIASGLAPVDYGVDTDALAIEVWGKQFANPLGMAAGWDKHAAAIDGLFNLGFAYVEVGSVTPEPQSGNPKPRLFRIPEIDSVVNRYGFNSEGHSAAVARLRTRIRNFVSRNYAALPSGLFQPPPIAAGPDHDPIAQLLASPAGSDARIADSLDIPRSLGQGRILGINLGKNKTSDPDSIDDFVNGVKSLGPYADVLVVNVSSPNTPGLRNLQRKGMLSELLEGVVAARDALGGDVKPPVLVKIAPDNDKEQLLDIAHAVQSSGVDGIIVSNTTVSRPSTGTTNPQLQETGGLSGPPVKPLALKALSTLYEATEGKVPLVGCGGISSGQDAVDFAKAGATLVQMYTSFIYQGVGLPRKVKDEVMAILDQEKTTWAKLVGSGRAKAAAISSAKPKESLTDKKEAMAVPMNEAEFKASVAEARKELDDLLSQLGDYERQHHEKPEPLSATQTAVPAPVAESIPVEQTKQTAPETVAVDGPVADALGIPALPTSNTAPADACVRPSQASQSAPVTGNTRTPKIDESPLAVPAQALLDDKAIAALLDPAKAQVEAGLKTSEAKLDKGAQEVKEDVKDNVQDTVQGAKRWV